MKQAVCAFRTGNVLDITRDAVIKLPLMKGIQRAGYK